MPRIRIPQSQTNKISDSFLMTKRIHLTRQFEVFNTLVNIEQAHIYHLQNDKEFIGEIYEQDTFGKHIYRQFTRLTRPFELNMHVNSSHYRIHRPFSFINSRVTVSNNSADIGKVHSHWHIIRRRYDLFQLEDGYRQFGRIDTGFWSWDFVIKDENNQPVCFINRYFRGIFKEMLTDQGRYEITFEDPLITKPLNFQQRLIALSCAIGIDYDYFSKHSGMFGPNIQLRRQRELPETSNVKSVNVSDRFR